MRDVFVIDALRTPIGRYGGALANSRPDDLVAHVIAAAVERNELPPADVDEVYMGCTNQAGEDNRNVARMGLLLAGLPVEVPGVTVNRLCASGLEAVNQGARQIMCGDADLVLAGGVESMTRAPLVTAKPDRSFPRGNPVLHDTTIGWRFTNPRMEALGYTASMGETAENVAERYGIDRADQDEFALESHRRAVAAAAGGSLRRGDGARAGPAAQGRSRHRALGRGPPPGHDPGAPRAPAPRIPRRRDRDRRQLLADQRWRRLRRACHQREGSRAGARATGAHRVERRRRRGPVLHGRRTGPGDSPGARARRSRHRGHRPRRAERGVRLPGAGLCERARNRPRAPERERRRDRARPPTRVFRRAAPDHPRVGDAPPRVRGAASRRCASGSGRASPPVVENPAA